MTAEEIRAVTNIIIESAKPESADPLDIQISNTKLMSLAALMIGEIAAQLADINKRFSPENSNYGPN